MVDKTKTESEIAGANVKDWLHRGFLNCETHKQTCERWLKQVEEDSEEWETMSYHIGIGFGKIFTEKSKSKIPKDNYKCLEMAEKMCKENSEILMKRVIDLKNAIKIYDEAEI